MQEIFDRTLVSIMGRRGCEDAVRGILEEILSCSVPEPGCYCNGKFEAFWIGQSQWMIRAQDSQFDIVSIFSERFQNIASITEQTDGWCQFSISGQKLHRLCSLLCNIDTRSFEVGMVSRTSIEHISCYVLMLADNEILIIGPRSYAGSLLHAINSAAKSVPTSS